MDIGALLGGLVPGAEKFSQASMKEYQFGQLPEEIRAETKANPSDVAAIKNFLAASSSLTQERRDKEIKKLRDRISLESVDYFNLKMGQLGQAPSLGMETWGAPEAAKNIVQQMLMGTQPGFLQELAIGQLPVGERATEMGRRTGRIEARYPGATEVGRGIIPTGTEGILTSTEAARQRARQAGEWGGVTGLTKGWTGRMMPFAKMEDIDNALSKGLINDRQASAARTFVDRTRIPGWGANLSDTQLDTIGVTKRNGVLANNLSDNPAIQNAQLNLRDIYQADGKTLADWDTFPVSRQEQMRMAAFGKNVLTSADARAIDAGESRFSPLFTAVINNPLASHAPFTPGYNSAMLNLLAVGFSLSEIAMISSIASDPTIVGGINVLVDMATAQSQG